MQFPINKTISPADGLSYVVDAIELAPYGVIRVTGWSQGAPKVWIKDELNSFPRSRMYRRHRPDVAAVIGTDDPFLGFSVEFSSRGVCALQVMAHDVVVASFTAEQASALGSREPEYRMLLDGVEVLHREHMYGEGPPNGDGHPDIVALAMRLKGPVLDFGCGNGHMVKRWSDAGVDARGVEIDRPAVRAALIADVSDRITLYDGSLPLPFETDQFESVYTSEVIEHVPAFERTLAELARVCRKALMVTVPDMAAVPIGSIHSVVPWHMLEATHVNFFNRHSLAAALRPHFRTLEFFNLGAGTLMDGYMPGSLGCIATK